MLYNKPKDTVFNQRMDLSAIEKHYLSQYRRIKIRNDSFEAFEQDCKFFREIKEAARILFMEGTSRNVYVNINYMCKNLSRNFCKLREVMDLREQAF